jgi:photosystem II stability/assembly factor-like uncharacterized protein
VIGGVALCAVILLTADGQEAPPQPDSTDALLENSGKPMTLPLRCTEDDMAWAGMSCSEHEPCPVYLEVTAAEGVGSQIFATGNLHADTVTLYSVLLRSQDAGKTWREGFERIRGAGLDHIQFTDFANGWASGESLFPLPQDPFLLITADGGKTWRRQPVFDETEAGSIQQFFFSSKDAGSLIIDRGEGSGSERYALYESPNAGGTWMVKQISGKPLRLPRAPDTAESWRVQADRTTRAFRVEQRQGERWITAASFAVSAGVCKPALQEDQPPEEKAPEVAPEPTVPKRPRR